ncbi:ATP-binding protein [Arcanobacterium bovis]|uniref:Transcriptional regulator n=1 Tax=Arcanobacterium bovis TaxID=2529275 RepID=A0A4Q9UZG3_9ACTO|nr:ATP-binding protein [Arcanobacterium bovis]TBW21413.1 transcriptional regulator [Arcanobacterium bovis]
MDLSALIEDTVATLRAHKTDNLRVEAKAAVGGVPKKLSRTISAFSNTAGGLILLGLDENAGFIPAENFDAKRIADGLSRMCADDLTPPIRAQIEIVLFEDSEIVVAIIDELPAYDKPAWITTAGKYASSYVRGHDGDRALTNYEIDRLEENKGQPAWDIELVLDASESDLNSEIVNQIILREKTLHPRVFGALSDDEAKVSLHLLKRGDDGTLHPTMAGLLVAGKYPQQYFPRLNLTVSVFPGTDKSSQLDGKRFLDNVSLVGPIPYLVSDAVAAISRNMRIGGVVDGTFRHDLPDYPLVALREAITNALMHRDYSLAARGSQVQINMYADRLEIINPGGLFGPLTIDTLGQSGISAARNQFLSRLLETTSYPGSQGGFVAENRGTGFAEIVSQMTKNLMPTPRVTDSLTQFKIEFLRRNPTTSEKHAAKHGSSADAILQYLSTHTSATSKELAAAAGISVGGVRRLLNNMVASKQLERLEPLRSPKQRYRLIP